MDEEFSQYAKALRNAACAQASRQKQSEIAQAEAAVAANLLRDHRISPTRLHTLGATRVTNLSELNDALVRYKKAFVCPAKSSGNLPAYTLPENNNNIARVDPDTELVTVLNLSYWGRAFSEAFAGFELGPAGRTAAVTAWLTAQMPPSESRRPFVETLLNAINRYRRETQKYLGLTWAAEAKSVERYLVPHDPRMWLKAVGVKTEDSVWLVVVKYPAFSGGRYLPLFRPTQLDAGWYAYHFPSPPQAPAPLCGHTMYLADEGSRAPREVVNEFIHPAIDFSISHWDAPGGLIARTAGPVGGDLARNRREHGDFLVSKYGPPTQEWLTICE